jgi:hypothetical protein
MGHEEPPLNLDDLDHPADTTVVEDAAAESSKAVEPPVRLGSESARSYEEHELKAREELRQFFDPLFAGTGGLDSWLSDDTPDEVFGRLFEVERNSLTRAQLNQLLVLSSEAGVSEGFFRYYWRVPSAHPYDVRTIPGFSNRWVNATTIVSLDHLKWGLYRFYVDALLFFGNIRSAFRSLRDMSEQQLMDFFLAKRIDTDALIERGASLPLKEIPKDERYLISEMACKSFVPTAGDVADLRTALFQAYESHRKARGRRVTGRELLTGEFAPEGFADREQQLMFSADELLDQEIESPDDLELKYAQLAERFLRARGNALENTRLYLSMIEELDVYVATSMRTRQDFRDMGDFCDRLFGHHDLRHLNIRYFDPTLSAAEGHEDKGLIECLMVKCAKVLVYSAGSKESWGKDAEAAMALSLGKPVIFYCDDDQRRRFYRDVHPLSRLIDFQSGITVGAMVTSSERDVAELLGRIFENRMEYVLEQNRPGHLQLKERRTESVVRLQTSDRLLRQTFWNYYQREPPTPDGNPGVGAPRHGPGTLL